MTVLVAGLSGLTSVPSGAAASEFPVRFSIVLEGLETTHIGAYDEYVAPVVDDALDDFFGRDDTGSSGDPATDDNRDNVFDGLLPGGDLPDDFSWTYKTRPGIAVSLEAEFVAIRFANGGSPRLSVSFMRDATTVRLKAPSGFGILVDPTRAVAHSEFMGAALIASAPLYRWGGESEPSEFRLGIGALAQRSKTWLDVRSDFIQLRETVKRQRVYPVAQMEFGISLPESISQELHVQDTQLRTRIFGIKTDSFYEIGLGAGISFGF